MTLTVPRVLAWRPHDLVGSADGIDALSRRIDESMHGLCLEQDVLAESWHGGAAIAAAERVVGESSTAGKVAGALSVIAREYRTASGMLDGVRSDLARAVNAATMSGYTVGDDGVVDASAILAKFPPEAPLSGSVALAQLEVMNTAAELTVDVVRALIRCVDVSNDALDRIRKSVASAEGVAQAVSPGQVAPDGNGGFSWAPDKEATAASAVVGFMTDMTGKGLERAAVESSDDLARMIGKGLGPVGAVVGVVPAILNDINIGDMDPTKAIVSEGVGAGAGYIAGGWIAGITADAIGGAAAGSVVPGPGTLVGAVVGVGVGAVAAWGFPKVIQYFW